MSSGDDPEWTRSRTAQKLGIHIEDEGTHSWQEHMLE